MAAARVGHIHRVFFVKTSEINKSLINLLWMMVEVYKYFIYFIIFIYYYFVIGKLTD